MSSLSASVIVFADVDAAPACPFDRVDRLSALLETLAADRIGIVFLSRRTRAEVEGIRQSLGIFHPFVCEHGAGAFVPRRYFGADLAHARRVDGYEAIDFASPCPRESGGAVLVAHYGRRREYDDHARGAGPAVGALTALYRSAFGAVLTIAAPRLASPPPRTQVEWLERIIRDLGHVRTPAGAGAAAISPCGGAEIPSSRDSPPAAATL